MRDRYDSVTHLASFGRPVLVVIAERDIIVNSRIEYDARFEGRQIIMILAPAESVAKA